MTDKQLLEQALEALEYHQSQTRPVYQTQKAITAIQARLEQPEQELDYSICPTCGGMADDPIVPPEHRHPAPVQEPLEYWNAVEGWVKIDEVRQHFDSVGCGTIYKNAGEDRVPLYTVAQRKWIGLTQQDIDIAFDDTQEGGGFDEFARAIEQRLKEKNT